MRSSSSRNLASSPNSSRAVLRNQVHPPQYNNPLVPHEKFITMQVLQLVLFTTRTIFLMYDIVHAVMHKEIIYERIGIILGGSPLESENLYTAGVGLTSLFLISLIICTFVYNYFLVHENLIGVTVMSLYLLLVLIYNLATFGSYSILESCAVCGASALEIFGLFYLLKLIKHKKEVRYVQHFEKRFSASDTNPKNGFNGHGSLIRQLPHQRKFASPTPPSITISYTGDGDNESDGKQQYSTEQNDESVLESEHNSPTHLERDESERNNSEREDEHREQEIIDHEKQNGVKRHSRHRSKRPKRERRKERDHSSENYDSDDHSVHSGKRSPTQHQSHHKQSSQYSSKDHLTVPGQKEDEVENESEYVPQTEHFNQNQQQQQQQILNGECDERTMNYEYCTYEEAAIPYGSNHSQHNRVNIRQQQQQQQQPPQHYDNAMEVNYRGQQQETINYEYTQMYSAMNNYGC
ncbi:hypothetical protein BLOT_005141 [Blomia tropicalis]|nr:hypothetical protein BLOT_005141 [Blomia tropicalis]